jgi:hypothetical protein
MKCSSYAAAETLSLRAEVARLTAERDALANAPAKEPK